MHNHTEIVVILDRSGSMQAARTDHEGGLNSFVRDQRGLAGDVRFTLVQFDSHEPCEIVYDGVPIAAVGPCTLVPRGATPLCDAIGKAVAHVSARLAALASRPDQVIVMVITDGLENASVEWDKARVKALIAEREAIDKWTFLYLGANVDAFAESEGLGIARSRTLQYANVAQGVQQMYQATSENMLRARNAIQTGGGAAQANAAFDWTTEQQRAAQAATEQQRPVQSTSGVDLKKEGDV